MEIHQMQEVDRPNVVFTTLPSEGEYYSWATPKMLDPKEVKYMPLGLLSLASNVHNITTPVVFDPASDNWSIDETVEKINELNPDVIGFSAVSRRVYALYELLEKTKVFPNPGWKIVGGPHATFYAEDLIKHGADAVFIGQLADSDLLQWLQNPKKGIFHCKTDINELSHPRRAILDYEKYYYEGKILFESSKRMHMFSSVGCPHACNFCSVQSRKVQYRTPRSVLGEMWHMDALGAESIHFMDDNFNTSAKHVTGILDMMESTAWEKEWSIRGQIKFDLSLVPRMRERGLRRIHVGIESLNDDTLAWFGKNHRRKDIEEFCKVMADNKIEVLAYMIIGAPPDTDAQLDSLGADLRGLGISQAFINILFPMPDTPYYASLLKDGTYKRDIWAEYMKKPTPDFHIPYPFGEKRGEELQQRAETIIKGFMK